MLRVTGALIGAARFPESATDGDNEREYEDDVTVHVVRIVSAAGLHFNTL